VLTDEALRSFDASFKVAPPLRSAGHVAALRAGLADGTIDAIATDHAPHAAHLKEREIDAAPCGMTGLETALGVVLAELVEPGVIAIDRAIALLSSSPASILRAQDHGAVAPGRPANIVVIDPEAVWTPDASSFASRSANSPFIGRKLRGRVVHTLLRGEPTVHDGKATR
jgi:dihydroorotase